MIFRKHAHRIAVVLIMAILVTQFNVISYGAETGSFGSEGSAEGDASVSEPVIRFTVPTRPADPEPEAPDYRTMFSTPSYTPIQLPIAIAEMKQPSKAGTEPAAVPESTPIPQSGQEQTSAPVENPQPQPIPVFTDPAVSDPAQTPTPAPGNTNVPPADEKESSKPEAETNRPDEDEGIPEGTPERIRELIRAGRLRAAEGSLSDNNAEKDTVSDDSLTSEIPASIKLQKTMLAAAATIPVDKITLLMASPTYIEQGDSFVINYVIEPSNATDKSVTWTSSDPSKVKIDRLTGDIEAIGLGGPVTITVRTSNGKTGTCQLIVTKPKPKEITLSVPSSIVIYVGETKSITATIKPDNLDADRKKLDWKSSNTSIATAVATPSDGPTCVVTGRSPGTTTVTVTAKSNEDCFKTCTVTVKKKATGITVSPKSHTIKVGEYYNLTARVTPSDSSTDTGVTWRSSDTSKVTVDSSGRVYGRAVGQATITAACNGGTTPSDTCLITVEPEAVTGITVSPKALTVTAGKSITGVLKATLTPSDATVKGITWTSADTNIARVTSTSTSGNPVTVEGVTARTQPVRIFARSQDGNFSDYCDVTVVPPTPVSKVNISPKTLTLDIGQRGYVSASVEPEDATNKNIRWEIVNEAGEPDNSIAEIYSSTYTNCTIRGKKTGTAKVKAISLDNETLVDYCTVTVNPMSITIPGQMTLEEETSGSLTATVRPSGVTYKEIRWSIDSEIATLAGNGNRCTVTALSANSTKTATITATLVTNNDEEYSAECALTVNKRPVPVTGLEVDPTSMTVKLGDTLPLTWNVLPEGADETTVTLISNDPETASVSPETGTGTGSASVSGCSVGETDITVTTAEGISRTCHVIVEWIQPTSVALSCDEIWLVEGETYKLEATVYPFDADDKTVSWNSAAPSIASVDQSGLVTAVSEGTTVVTVVSNEGGHKAVCAVHVRRPGTDVDGITVTPSENTVNVGQVFTAEATVTPDEATDKTVKWKSNNPAVASVSSNGLTADITARAVGSAVISATASNGMTAFCIVNVEKGIVHVREVLIPMYETIYTGQSASLPATVKPDDADDKTLIWTSSDEDTVSVNSAGRIFGKKEGQATIKATAADGGAYSECLVTVEDLPKPAPEKYTVIPVDKRPGAYLPELEIAAVESLEGDRYLVIFDSDGAAIKRRIRGDTSLSYTRAIFCDMLLVDEYANPKDDFIRCTVRIPLPPEMDIHKGTVRVVSLQGENLDKSIPSSVGEYDGVAYVTFTTTHFSEYAILYKENKKEEPKVVTKIEYRDKPVVQYVKEPEKKSQTEVKPAASQPAPAPVVITRILDNIPKTGDISQ